MTISELGIELIKHYENLHDGDLTEIGLQPKLCPSSVWTCGWGHAIIDPITKKFVTNVTKNGKKRAYELYPNLSLEEAEDLLQNDLLIYEKIVKRNVNKELTQYQFDALVSHTFNTGGSTTLFRYINKYDDLTENKDIEKWWKERYITGSGKKLKGLICRRNDEYHLFKTGELKFTNI